MANVPETPTYTAGIYQLEITDSVLGGASGISNSQAQQLANRTAYLKAHMDTAEGNIASNTTAIGTKAPLASPTFTGVPAAPTATAGTNTTQIATTAFVTAAVAALNVAQYAPLASPTFTGTPAAPTATAGTNTTQIATTAFVTAADTALSNSLTSTIATKAPLASPALTGTPTAPTATAGTNSTQIATTAFVTAADSALSSTLNTSISTKWTKSGDQATGDHGINVAPVSQTGLTVQSTAPDAGFAIRCLGDMRIKPAASQTAPYSYLSFQSKDGSWTSSIGLQTGTETIRFFNNAGTNVAVIDTNGNIVGANIEVAGTFTPNVAGGTTAGTCTYTERKGDYTVVGNMCWFALRVTWTGHTGTGPMLITGLPFNAAGTTGNWVALPAPFLGSGNAPLNGDVLGLINVPTNTVQMFIRTLTAAGGYVPQTMTTSGDIIIAGMYRYR